jgi:CP family cyanate transporter-like MFS transporter
VGPSTSFFASASRLRLLALVAAVAFQLRSVVLGVPPVLPMIRDDLHLSFTAAGALTAIPVLCLGAAALPGAVLVNRFGARQVVGAGTVALGVAALLRLAPPAPAALYVWSAAMALGAAMAQPAMVSVLRAWFAGAVQRAASLFTTALSLGGLAGSALTIHLVGLGGWRGTFVIWAVLALAAGVLWLVVAPGRDGHQPQPGALGELVRDRAVWHVAAMFGVQSLVYYAGASWMPFLLRPAGPAYLSLVLLLFNVVTIPVGFLLMTLRVPWATSRRYYALAGALMTLAAGAFVFGPIGLAWLFAIGLGVATGMTFIGTSALPALFARKPAHVAGYAALVLTAGYAISFAGPFLGGVLVDHTHRLESPFWLMTAMAACLVVLGATLPRRLTDR